MRSICTIPVWFSGIILALYDTSHGWCALNNASLDAHMPKNNKYKHVYSIYDACSAHAVMLDAKFDAGCILYPHCTFLIALLGYI